ncbi:MAG: prepilin-type N-terminal cleavage/methylation domain-containing protein [Desulfobacterales bacterium]|jgi:prepilin-type N-terminal cleavage/methylation domain-containing protein
MVNFRGNTGFTLIEIITVLALISLTLLITIPRIPSTLFTDETKKTSRWIIAKVQVLKDRAAREQKRYSLNIDLSGRRFWISYDGMSQDERQAAEKQGFKLPPNIRIRDVEYPDNKIVSFGQTEIFFYPKGYSDQAVIHLESGEEQLSFRIEPFLSTVKLFEEYVGLQESQM